MNHNTEVVLGNCQRLKSCITVASEAYAQACVQLKDDDDRILAMTDYLSYWICDLYITGDESGLGDIVLRDWLNNVYWGYLARELYVLHGAGEGYNEH